VPADLPAQPDRHDDRPVRAEQAHQPGPAPRLVRITCSEVWAVIAAPRHRPAGAGRSAHCPARGARCRASTGGRPRRRARGLPGSPCWAHGGGRCGLGQAAAEGDRGDGAPPAGQGPPGRESRACPPGGRAASRLASSGRPARSKEPLPLMLTREEDTGAHTVHRPGWTISPVAGGSGPDPTAIRGLARVGERTPGSLPGGPAGAHHRDVAGGGTAGVAVVRRGRATRCRRRPRRNLLVAFMWRRLRSGLRGRRCAGPGSAGWSGLP
jgi:hypothetical protein